MLLHIGDDEYMASSDIVLILNARSAVCDSVTLQPDTKSLLVTALGFKQSRLDSRTLVQRSSGNFGGGNL